MNQWVLLPTLCLLFQPPTERITGKRAASNACKDKSVRGFFLYTILISCCVAFAGQARAFPELALPDRVWERYFTCWLQPGGGLTGYSGKSFLQVLAVMVETPTFAPLF